ncbi:MAG: outer membrane protein assembly factor BamD [Candidatus Aminicenantes bacterium RBG_13_63_10]|nr:MAG: outer membrane protein assembly factor BamD [Candidatus Aminicenantes bacterium RBG_13_63_10]
MKRIAFSLAILLALLSAFSACKKKTPELTPEQTASDELLFKLGEQTLKKDPEKARLYLRQVIDSFPKSFYAQRAKLAIANSFFAKGDEASMILAAAEYREFISLYPYSPSASFAQYRIGMTHFTKSLRSGRDQTKTRMALAEFKKVLAQFPLSDEAKLAQEKIRECEEKLAEHEFSVGRFYYRRKAFKAATSRLTDILTTYPSYSNLVEVYFLLADSYFQSNKVEESLPFFTKLVSDYPQSRWAEKAQARLQDINAKKSNQPPIPTK